MKRPQNLLFLLALAFLAADALAQKPQAAVRQLFDSGWQFSRDGKTVSVDLPHDWDIYSTPFPDAPTDNGGGYYPAGKGVYTKKFPTPDGEVVQLHFEGVYQKATVMVNGQKAGQHAYGYTPFTVDITRLLHQDKKQLNEVTVMVDNSEQPNCRWYSGSGIYRHVWLLAMPAVHIQENGVVVKTPEVSAGQARVFVAVDVCNEGPAARRLDDIEVSFEGGDFVMAGSAQSDYTKLKQKLCTVQPGMSGRLGGEYIVSNPRLWSPADPYLYTATVRLKEKGQVIDEQKVRFGIRSVSFDAQHGFVLNGQPLKLNGACVHHDDGMLGAMAFDAAEVRKVRLMKESGFNLLRTSHNPSTRAFLDACDSLGMLVIDEAFDGWRTQKNKYDYSTVIDSCYREDLHAMVMRDRNHPSVISWSIGNEVIERKDIRVVTTARQMKRAILECDDTRPVTEALCAWDSDWEIYDPHAEVLDVVGYNYMMHKHDSDHRRDPQRVMWQTESYPRDAFLNWERTMSVPYIVGDIVWTGLDYLGESGIGRYYYEGETAGESWQAKQFPWHGAYCGDVDITGWRKPVSHYRDMLWNDNGKMQPYMAVKEPDGYKGSIKETMWSVWPMWESWNWPGWEGKPVEVEVYTKQPWVALYRGATLIGKQAVGRETGYKAVFTVDYQPGTLEAVTDIGRAVLSTAGAPARLRLTPDRTFISADGQDLAFITLEVVDRDGLVVPDAAIACQVAVNGQGSLLAAASANLQDLEPTTTGKVTTWQGRALIVVRSSQKRGNIGIAVTSSLPTARTSLKTR